MKTKLFASRGFVCLFFAVLFVSGVAHAQERNIWLPYATSGNGVEYFANDGSWWGKYNNNFMHQMGTTGNILTAANLVWNNTRVFYEETSGVYKSWYQNQGGTRAWHIYIANPTSVDFTLSGGIDRRLKLYMYEASGLLMDEATKWNDGVSTFVKWQYNPGPDIAWDSTENCFKVSVPAWSTVTVANIGNGGHNEILNLPPAPSVKYVSVRLCQPQGYEFTATLCGQASGHWRKYEGSTSSAFSTDWQMATFRYEGIDTTPYTTYNNCLELPYSKELWDPNGTGDWSTLLFIVNGHTATDTIHIEALRLNNTLVGYTNVNVVQNQMFSLAPSQLIRSSADNVVKVRIYGTRPIAMAMMTRWPPAANYVRGYRTHLESGSAANLIVNP